MGRLLPFIGGPCFRKPFFAVVTKKRLEEGPRSKENSLHIRIVRNFLVLSCLGCLLGCSGGPALPSVYPVRGTVKIAKGPSAIKNGTLIRFVPADLESVEAEGELKTDGSFVLKSIGDKEGVVPGKYKVVIDPRGAAKGVKLNGSVAIPQKYWTPEQTPLEVVVKRETNDVEFTVK